MQFSGRSILGFHDGQESGEVFHAISPSTGEPLPGEFTSAGPRDVDTAARLAAKAFATYSHVPAKIRAEFLRAVAGRIESIAETLIERAMQETALPRPRLQGEVGRTCNQLRLFAQVIEEGSWVGARIDRADPARQPAPKPDIRSMLHPIGPVVVFGASNFPLAFSVAGGDTASALAAGNPVIVKAHPAHPGTSALVGEAVREASRECHIPEGVFSLLFDKGIEVGTALVNHPLVKAVGFTGSRAAGQALMRACASRPEPIPFFGEMSSTNPVFVLPGAMRERAEQIAAGLHGSFTLGAGQFCTKPGIVLVPETPQTAAFVAKLSDLVRGSAAFTMLTPGIRKSYCSAVVERKSVGTLRLLAEAQPSRDVPPLHALAALFETDAQSFLHNPSLADEVFGPATLLVRYSTREQMMEIARNFEGHLTATLHATDEDLRGAADLSSILVDKVGRLLLNGFPTGVEVCHAMVHGGPYPATSDGRSTSVGSQAIFRFARLVCYQGFPSEALPDELKDANPLGIWRMVDGNFTRDVI